mmetsp:Transcript_31504/g.62955  ORF Transcript_31504/g.62955 Transcript_31504/m.62955 type:complete len:212 (-) Transcript_31504:233-868(-)
MNSSTDSAPSPFQSMRAISSSTSSSDSAWPPPDLVKIFLSSEALSTLSWLRSKLLNAERRRSSSAACGEEVLASSEAESACQSIRSLVMRVEMAFLPRRVMILFVQKTFPTSALAFAAAVEQLWIESKILANSSNAIQKRPFGPGSKPTSCLISGCSSHEMLSSDHLPFHSNALPHGFRNWMSRRPCTSATCRMENTWAATSPSSRLASFC